MSGRPGRVRRGQASIDDGTGTATITDNDDAPVMSIDDITIAERKEQIDKMDQLIHNI